jgi:thiamine biosynthesis lipoprotein
MLRKAGAMAGLVQVGGDTTVFGPGPDGAAFWTIDIRRPDGQGTCGSLRLRDVSVSTSGNYQRFVLIGGQRYSHIIDPRSGQTADHIPGVTIVAPSGVQTEIWSKVISVLGVAGLPLLPTGVEALVLLDAQGHKRQMSPGMARYLAPEK